MKNFIHSYKVSFLLLCLFIGITSCQDQNDLITEVTPEVAHQVGVHQGLDQADLATVFNFLADQENISELSLNEQFQLVQEYANRQGLSINLTRAIHAYENSWDQFETISEEEEFILSENRYINELIQQHGYAPDLSQALAEYREAFIQSTRKLDIAPASIQTILSMVDQINAMVNNPGVQRYIRAIDSDLLTPNPSRGIFDCCICAQLILAGIVTGCTFNPYACSGIPLAVWNVQQACNSAPVDPCLNSPNPCCGVHCASGFYCNANGVCVVDPNDPGCINNGCPPGQVCAGNTCIPL